MKYINWYLVEIERRLHGRLPNERVEVITRELEDHLLTAANELGDEQKAIDRFGQPSQVAENLVKGNGGTWRHARIAGIVAVVLAFFGSLVFVCVDILDQVFRLNWPPIMFTFLAVLAVACFWARRIFVMEFSFAMVFGIILTSLYIGSTTLDLGPIDGKNLVRIPPVAAFPGPSPLEQRISLAHGDKAMLQQMDEASQHSSLAQSVAIVPTVIPLEIMYYSLLLVVNVAAYSLAIILSRVGRKRRTPLQV